MFESPVGLNNSNNNNNYSSNNNRTKWLFFYFISLVATNLKIKKRTKEEYK